MSFLLSKGKAPYGWYRTGQKRICLCLSIT
nr:MAG TPA: bacteriocin [Caudoviricetes sp.]